MSAADEVAPGAQRLSFDVVIVGGGAAGSAAAAVLGARGVDAALIDLHDRYPEDVKADKVAGDQIPLMQRLGLFEALEAHSVRSETVVNMRRGRVLDRALSTEYNLPYEDLVNAIRTVIPENVPRILGKVLDIEAGPDRQIVRLATGERIEARLVVLATGGGEALRSKLGVVRRTKREKHSVTIVFDLEPADRAALDFDTLTIYGDAPRDRIDYISVFPFRGGMRANLFMYRDLKDPFFAELKADPKQAVLAVLPALGKALGDFEIVGKIHARPVDLYVVDGFERPGVVIVGDAFRTSCPAVGDGLSRGFTDVDRLCNVHIPEWLATPGMGVDKIMTFYCDPDKLACDARAAHAAEYRRNSTVGVGLGWTIHRRRVLLQRRLRAMIAGALPGAPRRAPTQAAITGEARRRNAR